MPTDYRRSIRVVRALPCEIMLAPHASFIDGSQGKLARIRAGSTADPLVDPAAAGVGSPRPWNLELEW
jgi:hypothetical protein